MNCDITILGQLLDEVTAKYEKPLRVNRDFIALGQSIYSVTKSMVSTSTLKRLWKKKESEGCVSQNIHTSTLDIFALYIGYEDFIAYQNNCKENPAKISHQLTAKKLISCDINTGQQICLTWNPDRQVVIMKEDGNHFCVVSSTNSKLQAGDKFELSQIIERCPLILQNLKREGFQPMDYVCGQDCSLNFEKI